MKKKILYAAILCILLSLVAQSTLAYFTTEDTARNVITTGKVDVVVEEWQQTAGGLVAYPSEPIAVMPAATVSKIVTVKSVGSPCFIRAKLDVTVKDASNKVMDLSKEQMDKIITLVMNDADWTEKDGWWYYTKSVGSEVTEPLMTQVVFDGPNMTNEYQNCTVLIDVTAQAVQAANNGETVWEAAGWPEA